MLYPLLLGAVSILGSIVGCAMVRHKPGRKIMSALYTGLWWAAELSLIDFAVVTWLVWGDEAMRGSMLGRGVPFLAKAAQRGYSSPQMRRTWLRLRAYRTESQPRLRPCARSSRMRASRSSWSNHPARCT